MVSSCGTASYCGPPRASRGSKLSGSSLLEQNPDLDREQIQEVREFVKQRRREGHGKTYEIDSPYERGPIVGPESARHAPN